MKLSCSEVLPLKTQPFPGVWTELSLMPLCGAGSFTQEYHWWGLSVTIFLAEFAFCQWQWEWVLGKVPALSGSQFLTYQWQEWYLAGTSRKLMSVSGGKFLQDRRWILRTVTQSRYFTELGRSQVLSKKKQQPEWIRLHGGRGPHPWFCPWPTLWLWPVTSSLLAVGFPFVKWACLCWVRYLPKSLSLLSFSNVCWPFPQQSRKFWVFRIPPNPLLDCVGEGWRLFIHNIKAQWLFFCWDTDSLLRHFFSVNGLKASLFPARPCSGSARAREERRWT